MISFFKILKINFAPDIQEKQMNQKLQILIHSSLNDEIIYNQEIRISNAKQNEFANNLMIQPENHRSNIIFNTTKNVILTITTIINGISSIPQTQKIKYKPNLSNEQPYLDRNNQIEIKHNNGNSETQFLSIKQKFQCNPLGNSIINPCKFTKREYLPFASNSSIANIEDDTNENENENENENFLENRNNNVKDQSKKFQASTPKNIQDRVEPKIKFRRFTKKVDPNLTLPEIEKLKLDVRYMDITYKLSKKNNNKKITEPFTYGNLNIEFKKADEYLGQTRQKPVVKFRNMKKCKLNRIDQKINDKFMTFQEKASGRQTRQVSDNYPECFSDRSFKSESEIENELQSEVKKKFERLKSV